MTPITPHCINGSNCLRFLISHQGGKISLIAIAPSIGLMVLIGHFVSVCGWTE